MIDSYADNMTITETGNTVKDFEIQLNQDCANVITWMKLDKMKINSEKTHFLVGGTKRRQSFLNRPLPVVMDDVQLIECCSKSEQLLGCTVKGNLKWAK